MTQRITSACHRDVQRDRIRAAQTSTVQIYGTSGDIERKATGGAAANFTSRRDINTTLEHRFRHRGAGRGLKAFSRLESAVNFDAGTTADSGRRQFGSACRCGTVPLVQWDSLQVFDHAV